MVEGVPNLNIQEWDEIINLIPFLELFKGLTLMFSQTTRSMISLYALEFEDLFVQIKLKFTSKKSQFSSTLNYAIEAAVAKLYVRDRDSGRSRKLSPEIWGSTGATIGVGFLVSVW